MSELLEKARDWCIKWNCPADSGVVIFHNDEIQGWCIDLLNPEAWTPGCIAMDFDGNVFIATGGDDYNGAEEWLSVNVDSADARSNA